MAQPEEFAGWRPVAGSPQEAFLQRTEFEGLYGGAAGGMKTETLINLPVEDILRIPNISVAFFRRQYGQMEDVIARARELFAPLGAEYNESKHRFTFQNGSRYYFHHMQHEKDKLVYQGRKFEIVLFDELTHFTESQYLYLFSRCRGNPKVRWRIRSATNPGGVGHGWVKRRWIESLKPYKTAFFLRVNGDDVRVHPKTEYARSRFWMPAKVWDNPYLRETDYVANLMALEEEVRRMLLEGEWDIFSGQFFSMWRKAIHVVEPFRLPEHWNYFGGFDYGHRNPTAYVIGAVDPDGGLWIVREHYRDNKSVEWHAREIKKLEESLPFGVKVKARLADPSIWTRTPQETEAGTDDSIAMMYARHGLHFLKANNQRAIGWAAMKEYLDWEDKGQYNGDSKSIARMPRMRIFANCTNLIRTLPDLVYEEVEGRRNTQSMFGEDLDTRGDDHLEDATRYMLMHVYNPVIKKAFKNDWRTRLKMTQQGQKKKTIVSFT